MSRIQTVRSQSSHNRDPPPTVTWRERTLCLAPHPSPPGSGVCSLPLFLPPSPPPLQPFLSKPLPERPEAEHGRWGESTYNNLILELPVNLNIFETNFKEGGGGKSEQALLPPTHWGRQCPKPRLYSHPQPPPFCLSKVPVRVAWKAGGGQDLLQVSPPAGGAGKPSTGQASRGDESSSGRGVRLLPPSTHTAKVQPGEPHFHWECICLSVAFCSHQKNAFQRE